MNQAQTIREQLSSARHVVVMTGAGVSAESGIPTFRDAMSGLWAKYDPQELATPQAFRRDPELVSKWYDERRLKARQCQPNPGHDALAALEKSLKARGAKLTIVTQNVDGLHHRAGSVSVIEVHGSIDRWRCFDCDRPAELPDEPLSDYPTSCECGGLMRPGVVWFGESLPPDAVVAADAAVNDCDLFFSVGTSAVVYPAAGWIGRAVQRDVFTVEINPGETPYSDAMTIVVRAPSGEFLPKVAAAL
jgi:NAD-dependent deacetylase